MTIEEAIKFAQYAPQLSQEPEVREFYRMCEKALRAQKVTDKLDRNQWKRCKACRNRNSYAYVFGVSYCPNCGRPITEEAWAKLERRINDGTTD